MKPPPFRYFAPDTVDEALELMSEHGWDAKALAGGQSLVPAMNFRLARPAVLVDLNRIGGLDSIEPTLEGGLRIGAMTRQRTVERSAAVARRCPLLHEVMPWIAHPQIRNRGTLGGSLAHADPAAEVPAVALAVGATLRVRGRGGERRVAAVDFFQGLMTTVLEPEELLLEVELPPPAERTGVAFEELARRHGDYALVGAAVQVQLAADGSVAEARIGLLSVADRPLLATAAAEALTGRRPDAAAVGEAAAAARGEVDPPEDMHASARYRRHLVGVLVRRALERALRRAEAAA